MRIVHSAAIAFLFLAAALPGQAAPCGSTGLYRGSADVPGGSKVEVTLNLYCDNGSAAAQLFTSMGDFGVKDVAGTPNGVHVAFDSGASLGTLELDAKDSTLAGAFTLAGDKGSVSLTRVGDALAANALNPTLDLTPAQWREDLNFFARELPLRHANAFFLLSKSKFEAEIAALDARLDRANGDEVFVALQAIAKSIGDGHTGVNAPGDRRVMPLQFARFGKDIRVVATGPGLERALGARLLKVAATPVAEVWRRVLTLTPQGELMELRRSDALVYLSRGYALHGLGVTSDRTRTTYTLANDAGKAFRLEVKGLPPGESVPMKSGYSNTALRFQQTDQPFWCKPLPANHALYCAWHAYQQLDVHAKAMFTLIAQLHPAKLILDMRDNGGGDNTVGDAELIKPLKASAEYNVKGKLYVLIGAETFSAAMNNAAQFQDETNAILVGETIGEKPNSYQEPRQFRLPNSHLVVRASTLYYTFRKSGENAVRPNKQITPTWNDVKAGRDPALDWVLAQPAG